ncbi:CLIP-associating protein 1-A-like [Poecilia latipinna]|uniref:CLIP-associating protein 1-A-like n=1 Tax=Poecilia latipinna TaxID=48699 RepID=UPI00072DB7D8|nr:PREDICTED: CLIP-associating protein 1-A-like [Poecilia latipinna]
MDQKEPKSSALRFTNYKPAGFRVSFALTLSAPSGSEVICLNAELSFCLLRFRESFPFDQQFNILMRFIVDQTQTPNLKVKVAILKYIESLGRQMDPTDFVNSSETRLAVSRIITWTTEPKSSDVRKVRGISSEIREQRFST